MSSMILGWGLAVFSSFSSCPRWSVQEGPDFGTLEIELRGRRGYVGLGTCGRQREHRCSGRNQHGKELRHGLSGCFGQTTDHYEPTSFRCE
jgi:hypothetical protein